MEFSSPLFFAAIGEKILTLEGLGNDIIRLDIGSPDMPPAPDIRVARRLDGLGIARQARDAGMRAIVMKSHHWPTGALTRTIQPIVQEVALFGTVVLNYSIGGLNPFAIEVAANIGCPRLIRS